MRELSERVRESRLHKDLMLKFITLAQTIYNNVPDKDERQFAIASLRVSYVHAALALDS